MEGGETYSKRGGGLEEEQIPCGILGHSRKCHLLSMGNQCQIPEDVGFSFSAPQFGFSSVSLAIGQNMARWLQLHVCSAVFSTGPTEGEQNPSSTCCWLSSARKKQGSSWTGKTKSFPMEHLQEVNKTTRTSKEPDS